MTAANVIIHGCRSNLAERDALEKLAPDGATVINSCAVTAEAMRDARAAVRKAALRGPVIITGCAATIAPERFSDLARVVPNSDKLRPAAWGRAGKPAVFTRQTRGFVAIQDGCDHHCTFCVTRIARGRSRSIPPEDVVAHVGTLVGHGVKEVVLTGIDACSYGRDLDRETTLGELVQRILAGVPRLARLRLSSLDPAAVDPALMEALGDPRLMPHIHLSLQAGDDLVLKRMRRRHSRRDALLLIGRLRRARPDVALGGDFIAGFPTESEEAHRNSLMLLIEADLAHAHVFPYSPRPGTAAARMPPVPPAVARARAAALRERAALQHERFMESMLHKEVETISEGKTGLSPHGFRILFARPRPRGELVRLCPGRIVGGMLAA